MGRGSRRRWSTSSVRLRLLTGLAVLLVAGLIASSVVSGVLLVDFLQHRFVTTLQDNASRIRTLLASGPQTVVADQAGALLGPPLGIVAVDSTNAVQLSTGAGGIAPDALAAITAAAPVGTVVSYKGHRASEDLEAIRIPSPELIIHRADGNADVRPAALILCIDTSLDRASVRALILRQALIVAGALVILLGLAVVVLRLGMRPLSRMARTADAIAAGSLNERLPIRGDRSETDQVAEAVNSAFDAQARAEATVRSFAADASHELRTPLSTISGWLDLHRQGGLDESGLETALEHIDNEVGRMRLLVEELGLLARLDAGRPIDFEDIDMTALADSVVEDAQVIYPDRNITLTATEPTPVNGDSARLQQVLRNLVGNAVEHTPEESSVVVEVRRTVTNVEVRVIDDGPGIAPDDLPRVFERFWRAEASRSRAYGGSGLGLAIVEAITHAHRGHVDVRSTLGLGTMVTVTLPAGSKRE
jgi:two-component system, OmpR family, sensor kinase